MSFSDVPFTVSMLCVAVIMSWYSWFPSTFPVSCSRSCLDFGSFGFFVDSVIDFVTAFIRWFVVVIPSLVNCTSFDQDQATP